MKRLLGLLCLLTGLSGVAGGQAAPPVAGALRAGDVIDLTAWRDSAISGRYHVDERGRVVLPLVGEWQVDRTPWGLLRDSLVAAYAKEIQSGQIALLPKRRVLVLGFVTTPGVYYADPATAMAVVIAQAGGPAPDGDYRRVRLVRDGQERWRQRALDGPELREHVQSGDMLYVERRGWFDRNAQFFGSSLVSLAGIVVTLLVAR